MIRVYRQHRNTIQNNLLGSAVIQILSYILLTELCDPMHMMRISDCFSIGCLGDFKFEVYATKSIPSSIGHYSSIAFACALAEVFINLFYPFLVRYKLAFQHLCPSMYQLLLIAHMSTDLKLRCVDRVVVEKDFILLGNAFEQNSIAMLTFDLVASNMCI